MAKGTFKINEEWFAHAKEGWEIATDNFLHEMASTASSVAPKGKPRTSAKPGKSRRSTGSETEFTVDVELTPEGPRIPEGSRTSASASRYIKTKSSRQIKKGQQIGPGLYRHTFERRGHSGTRKTLAGSMKVIGTQENSGAGIVGFVRATVPYALWVHLGKAPHGSRSPKPFFTWTLGAHFDELKSGSFLKRR